jgi:hypothetical protein
VYAGIDDEGVVLATMTSRRCGDARFDVTGVISSLHEHVSWVHSKILCVGDKVQIEIVEAASFDEPGHRLGPLEQLRSKEDYVRGLVEELGWQG